MAAPAIIILMTVVLVGLSAAIVQFLGVDLRLQGSHRCLRSVDCTDDHTRNMSLLIASGLALTFVRQRRRGDSLRAFARELGVIRGSQLKPSITQAGTSLAVC